MDELGGLANRLSVWGGGGGKTTSAVRWRTICAGAERIAATLENSFTR
jgi:hypothetical protein